MRKTLLVATVLAVFAMPAAYAAPGNDDFAGATEVTTAHFSDSVDLSSATVEAGEPQPSCGPVDHTVWYRIPAQRDGELSVSTDGTSFNAITTLWVGDDISSVGEVACDFNGTSQVVAGNTYYVQAGRRSGPISGTLEIRIDGAGAEPPTNDDLANAKEVVDPLPFSDDVYLDRATREPGEVPACGPPSQHTVWYARTAQTDEYLNVAPGGDNPWVKVTAYDDDTSSPIACDYFGLTGLHLRAGHRYLFQVESDYVDPTTPVHIDFFAPSIVDAAVSNLKVERIPLQTDAGDLPGFRRRVSFDVSNLGPDSSFGTNYFSVQSCPRSTNCTFFAGGAVPETAGTTEHVVVDWTPFAVGDITIRVQTESYDTVDPNHANDEAELETYVLVGGTGVGVGLPSRCAVIICL